MIYNCIIKYFTLLSFGGDKMKINRFLVSAAAAVIAVLAAFCCGQISAFASESDFVIKTDADGDKYISRYNGSGGNVTIPDGVVWIGEKAFFKNTDITSVTIPKSCWYWIDTGAFYGCTGLKSVTFEGDIEGIGKYAFYGCTSLEKVTFGGSVGRGEGDGGIGCRAFYGCSSLKKVSFSDKNAKLDLIGEYAFMNCTALTSINLPLSLEVIYSGAFVNCARLSVLTVPAGAKLDGEHILGYMYGSAESGGKKKFAPADGKTILYFPEASEPSPQVSMLLVVAQGSDAERYAAANGAAYIYGAAAGTLPAEKLSAPKNIKAAADSDKIVLTWDALNGAAGYRVYMYNAETGKYKAYKSVRTAQCTIVGLKADTEYKFKIAALAESGGKYTAGTESDTVSVTTKDR